MEPQAKQALKMAVESFMESNVTTTEKGAKAIVLDDKFVQLIRLLLQLFGPMLPSWVVRIIEVLLDVLFSDG